MLIPVLHRILVKADEVETTTKSGIILKVDERAERAGVETGTVVAVGETAFRDYNAENTVSVGDKIYFARYSGKNVKDVDDVQYIMLNDEDVVAIIKDTVNE